MLSSLVSLSATGAAPARFGHPRDPVHLYPTALCVPGATPVSAARLRDAARLINARLVHPDAASHASVALAGPRCLRLVSTRGAVPLSFIVAAVAPGVVVLADSGSTPLQFGRVVRLRCARSGCVPSGIVGRTNLTRHPPTLRVVIRTRDIAAEHAQVVADTRGYPSVLFQLDSVGSRRFCRYTSTHVSHFLAFVADERVVSDPQIQSAICGGDVQIAGLRNERQAHILAAYLNLGPLTLSLRPVTSPRVVR